MGRVSQETMPVPNYGEFLFIPIEISCSDVQMSIHFFGHFLTLNIFTLLQDPSITSLYLEIIFYTTLVFFNSPTNFNNTYIQTLDIAEKYSSRPCGSTNFKCYYSACEVCVFPQMHPLQSS